MEESHGASTWRCAPAANGEAACIRHIPACDRVNDEERRQISTTVAR